MTNIMNGFNYTIQDLVNATALQRKYIDRCYEIMSFLEPFRMKSPEQNKYFYSAAAFDVFHQIADLKKRGMHRGDIKQYLEDNGVGKSATQPEEAVEVPTEEEGNAAGKSGSVQSKEVGDSALSKIEELYERMLTNKEEQISQARERVEEIKQSLQMLLPEGKTPDQVKADQDEAKLRLAEQAQQIKSLEEKHVKRQVLYGKLEALTGWRQRKERDAILSELKALE